MRHLHRVGPSLTLMVVLGLTIAAAGLPTAAIRGESDTPIPSSVTGAGTKLYVGQAARLTVLIPADWRADPSGRYDYVGPTASWPVSRWRERG